MRKPVYIVDAMNYIFRAYYALPDSIASPSGMKTNASRPAPSSRSELTEHVPGAVVHL